MKIRLFGALLCGAALLLATSAQAQSDSGRMYIGGEFGARPKPAETGQKGQARRATTVKSSPGSGGSKKAYSNFDRDTGQDRSQSSKSNTSDRIGGGSGSRTYFVGTANGGVWRGENNSIFDRWGNSQRGRVTGVAVDPSDPSGNRTPTVRGKRTKISDDNNPIPRDRTFNRGQKNSDGGFAQGNPMVHIRR